MTDQCISFIGRLKNQRTTMNTKLLSWSDYLYIGLALALMMSGRDEYRDGFYQLILVGMFFVLTGVKDNCGKLINFIRQYPIYAVATAIWTIYFSVINRTEPRSDRYALTVFFMIFVGYRISISDNDISESENGISASENSILANALEKLWMAIFVLLLVGVGNYIVLHDFSWRMEMFFTNSIAEGDAALVMVLISLFYIKDYRKKIAGVLLAFIVDIIGMLRLDTMVLIALMVVYAIIKRKEIACAIDDIFKKNNIKINKIVIFAIPVVILLIVVLAKKVELTAFETLFNRYLSAFGSLTKDVYSNYYGDRSFRIRIIAIDQAINAFRSGNICSVLLGGGQLSGYYKIKPAMTMLEGADGAHAGPIENAFFALLSDFGAMAFVFYLGTYISAFCMALRSKKKSVRIHAVFLMVIITVSAFIDMEYWINLVFFVWLPIGIYLGELVKAKEQKELLPSFMCSTAVVAIIYYLPFLYAWIRTVLNVISINYGKTAFIFLMLVIIISFVILLWNISDMLSKFIIGNSNRNNIAIIVPASVVLISVIVFMNVSISKARGAMLAQIADEKAIIKIIKENTGGKIYNDTFPLFYNEECGDIDSPLFSAASVNSVDKTTVIVNKKDDIQRLIDMGFLYLPISDNSAIYTNDDGVINTLKEDGYKLTGYYTGQMDINLTELAAENNLSVDSNGVLILDGENNSILKGPGVDIYPGEYTVTYNMRIEPTDYVDDYQLCVLKIRTNGAKEDSAAAVIMRSDFDSSCNLLYDLPLSAGDKGYDFQILPTGDNKVEICSISYTRTPDYDVHVKVNSYGDRLLEEYYDFDGNPYEIERGYCGVKYEYDDERRLIRQEYLNANGDLVVTSSGYAVISKQYNSLGQIEREEYYDDNINSIELSGGQAAVEYEYDENNNRIIDRFYDVDNNPVMYNDKFFYVERTYNEEGTILSEEYYDTEGNMVDEE